MKITVSELKAMIREAVDETLGDIGDGSNYAAAAQELSEFAKSWNMGYEETDELVPGAGMMKPAGRSKLGLEGPAWNGLSPFEKYALVAGRAGDSPEAMKVLGAAGLQSGVWYSSGLSKQAKASWDATDFFDATMGKNGYDAGSREYDIKRSRASMSRQAAPKKRR